MQRAAHNGLVDIDITVPDFEVKTAIRIGANPGFVLDSCPLAAKIRERHQFSRITFVTLGEINLIH
jgi:hypothetical protein